jgi:hypothetical protein
MDPGLAADDAADYSRCKGAPSLYTNCASRASVILTHQAPDGLADALG